MTLLKELIPIALVVTLVIGFISCSRPPMTTIESKEYTWKLSEQCTASCVIPTLISSKLSDSALIFWNSVILNVLDTERIKKSCRYIPENKPGMFAVKTDFQVLMSSDSLVCLEFITRKYYDGKLQDDAVYSPLTIYLGHNFRQWYVKAKDAILRKVLWKYIQQDKMASNMSINQEAYRDSSNYILTFSFQNDDLVLYPGGEGEMIGFTKINIPLKECMKPGFTLE